MRTLYSLCLLFSIIPYFSYSQDPIDFQGEVSKMVPSPTSPEASSIVKFGKTNVNLYSGTPDIKIPLYTFKGREMDLSLGLSYDASGIKVEQQATWAGLGWNFNAGGRITRITNGIPDDFYLSGSTGYKTLFDDITKDKWVNAYNLGYNPEFNSMVDAQNYFTFLEDINDNDADISPDIFSVNVPGLSDYIMIDFSDANLTARALKNPRLKITYGYSGIEGVDSWTITKDDGTIYYFSAAHRETTIQQIDNNLGVTDRKFTSSWLLTNIESPNKKDIYYFSYTPSGFWTQPFPASLVGHITNTFDKNSTNNTYPSGNYSTASSTSRIDQQFLTSISHNSIPIVSINLKTRNDLALTSNSAINEIIIRNYNTAGNLQTIKLNHSYFGNQNSSDPILDQRLKLDGIDIIADQIAHQKYSFEYDQASLLPPKNSKKQDYLGFYNGKNNTDLYPKYTAGGDTYQGGDLSPDFTYSKIGLLTKIIYPTGGHTSFVYEGNTTKKAGSTSSSSTSSEDVTYLSASLTGGTMSNNPYCQAYCDDKYAGAGDPNYKMVSFQVPEIGEYNLTYSKNGLANAEAVIVKGLFSGEIGGYIENQVWSTNGSSHDTYLNLEANTTYNLLLVNDGSNSISEVRIWREDVVTAGGGTNPFTLSYERSGIRIKSIKNYLSTSALASQKDYKYTESLTSVASSGVALYEPQLVYLTNYMGPSTEGTLESKTDLHRLSGGSGGSQSHIGYHTVYEIQKDVQNLSSPNPIGYTKYEFNTGVSDVVTAGQPPFYNQFKADYKIGKPKLSVEYDNSDNLVGSSESQYTDNYIATVKSTSFLTNLNNSFKYVHIYLDSDGKYRYDLLDPAYNSFDGQGGFAPPLVYNDPNNSCISDMQAATYNLRINSASISVGAPISSKTTQYNASGNLVKETLMSYDPTIDYLLREKSSTNSKAQEINEKFYYPKDQVAIGSTLLINKNQLTAVVKRISSENGAKKGFSYVFTDIGNNKILPTKLEIFEKDEFNKRDYMDYQYYTNGNLKQSNVNDGPPMVLIWGYSNQHPIAKIENATYQEVANALGVSTTTLDTYTEANLGAINALRNNTSFTKAMVTTYTYKPMVGVASMTDPKGQKTTYEYDGLGRLEFIKDKDNNLISENKYHYKN